MDRDPTRGLGQKVFEHSRVGSGRVGSDQEVFEISRLGSGRVGFYWAGRLHATRLASFDPTRELA